MDITVFSKGTVQGFFIKKDFQERYENVKVERGDIVLVCMKSICPPLFGPTTYHAGICRGDDQIVHLSERSGGILKVSPGNVCIQNINGFTSGKDFRILKKDGGVPKSFDADITHAMESEDRHDKSNHNCIDFSLRLLKVDPESYKQVEGPKRDAILLMEQGQKEKTEAVPLMEQGQKEKEPHDTKVSPGPAEPHVDKGQDPMVGMTV